MLSTVGVALVATPLAAAKLLLNNKFVRYAAVISLVAYASTRNYRSGEGPLSLKMPVRMSPGKGLGAMLYELSENSEDLRAFRDITFLMTRSEAVSIGLLIQAAFSNEDAVPALVDFLVNFPSVRCR